MSCHLLEAGIWTITSRWENLEFAFGRMQLPVYQRDPALRQLALALGLQGVGKGVGRLDGDCLPRLKWCHPYCQKESLEITHFPESEARRIDRFKVTFLFDHLFQSRRVERNNDAPKFAFVGVYRTFRLCRRSYQARNQPFRSTLRSSPARVHYWYITLH